ncbi:MAG: aldo/keto reductase [Melioribacteraceae bacterium]|nr:aldo/keto reductase [Melioribacteraceae bacterium]
MLYRRIGNTDMNASVIALGTWVMGGWMWGGADDETSIKTIHASIDAGINFIDTAPIYGFGRSEEIVGKALEDRRDKIILATKCGMRWDLEKGDFYFNTDEDTVRKSDSKYKVYKYLGPESIRVEIERSLKRLQTDYIDLYQTHWQDSTTPIEDTMAELLKLKEEGKIRAIGASNATVEQMKRYGALDADQEKYSMLVRKAEEEGNAQYCYENNIALLAYSPLAQGLLTGKIKPDREFSDGDVRKNTLLFSRESILKINSMLKESERIADKHNTGVLQIALAWTFNRKGITHLLCGARTVEQTLSNAESGNINLDSDDISEIDTIYARYF